VTPGRLLIALVVLASAGAILALPELMAGGGRSPIPAVELGDPRDRDREKKDENQGEKPERSGDAEAAQDPEPVSPAPAPATPAPPPPPPPVRRCRGR
jgi:hypothetical protein